MAEELKAETNRVLKCVFNPKPNITQEEAKALKDLRQEKDRVILTTSKGMTMVALDRQYYINKAKDLMAQR